MALGEIESVDDAFCFWSKVQNEHGIIIVILHSQENK